MSLLPEQVEQLKHFTQVSGRTADGEPLFALRIGDRATWARLQELTKLQVPGVPPWITLTEDGRGVVISTPNPQWFAELDREIQDARRPR